MSMEARIVELVYTHPHTHNQAQKGNTHTNLVIVLIGTMVPPV